AGAAPATATPRPGRGLSRLWHRSESRQAEQSDQAAAGKRPTGVMPFRSFLLQSAIAVGGPWGLGALGAGPLQGDYNLALILTLGTAVAIGPYAAMKYWKARHAVSQAWRREQAEFSEQLDQMAQLADQRVAAPLAQLEELVEGLERDAMELERRRDVFDAVLREALGGPPTTRVRAPRTAQAVTEDADLRSTRATAPAPAQATPVSSADLPAKPRMWRELVWSGVPGLVHAAGLVGIAYALSKGVLGTGHIPDTGLFDLGFQIDADWSRAMVGGAAAIVGGVAPALAERWFQRVTGTNGGTNGNGKHSRGTGADQEVRDNKATDRPFLRRTLGWLRPSVRANGNQSAPVGIWSQTNLASELASRTEQAAERAASQVDQLTQQLQQSRQHMDQLLSRTQAFGQLELVPTHTNARPDGDPNGERELSSRRTRRDLVREITKGLPQSIGSKIRLHGTTPTITPPVTPDPATTPGPATTPSPATPDPTTTPDPKAMPDPATTPDPTTTPDPATTPDPTTRPDQGRDPHTNRRPPRRPHRDPRPWWRRRYRKGYKIAQPPPEKTFFMYCVLVDVDKVIPKPPKPPPEPIEQPTTYDVRPGDTLWDIAERELGDPLRWPEIYKLNRGRPQPHRGTLQDPDLIQPGWTLKLPPRPPRKAGPAGTPHAPQPLPRHPHGQQPPGKPEAKFTPVGMVVIESTLNGVRSVRWLVSDPQWVAGDGVLAGLTIDQTPTWVDRGAAEWAAQQFGIVLPSEPELHGMMWG
ncbi:MAG: LysM peptidoglycan-binding domain-containing protein, partial [Micromonosporaceae bacterium]